ncbi:acyltransferase [Aquimarina sp. ERC-38]|uniref:acyltransferase n=1 Tax=Aquimarina sp. ERC-38 TaxID=2949996 RepID=UPI0022465736|nr:acyltransferase [Aquimarina sp. ERC-38]UZO81862.1 acyltransferase [Aquimarina sp. ERC-38]
MKVKVQIYYLVNKLNNIIYNLLPFFWMRKLYFSSLGNKIGKNSFIHSKVRFFCVGKIFIGNNSTVNFNCYLDSRCGLHIGNNVMIGHNSKLYTLGHDVNSAIFESKGEKIIIEDNVVLFSNVLVMPGSVLKEGCVVYTGAIVTGVLEPYTIYAGVPAEKINIRNREINYKLNHGFWFGN